MSKILSQALVERYCRDGFAFPVPVLDANKKVLDSVKEVLDVIAKNDMLLASGHLHVSETWIISIPYCSQIWKWRS